MMREMLTKPKRIDAKSAKEMIDKKQAVLIDVRTPGEYTMGHIGGANLLPLDTLNEQSAAALADKDAAVIVYCQSGARSAYAASQLAAMGYKNVFDLGGIFSWPYEITH